MSKSCLFIPGFLFFFCMDLEASGCQRRSEPKEKKEEVRLNDLGSEDLDREDLQVTTSRLLPFLGRII